MVLPKFTRNLIFSILLLCNIGLIASVSMPIYDAAHRERGAVIYDFPWRNHNVVCDTDSIPLEEFHFLLQGVSVLKGSLGVFFIGLIALIMTLIIIVSSWYNRIRWAVLINAIFGLISTTFFSSLIIRSGIQRGWGCYVGLFFSVILMYASVLILIIPKYKTTNTKLPNH